MRHANIAFFVPHVGCPNKCSFCNQNTISGKVEIPRAQDVKKVLSEAFERMSESELEKSEIAFFGGSFTAIERSYMIELLEAAATFVGKGKISGIRVSTRPDAIDDEVLLLLKKYGVTAIELGAQSMRDEVLCKNMRGHSAEDVVKASRLIKEYGFSLGLQMMTGLYGDDDTGAIETANRIIALEPHTVRIYPTVVLKGTYLGELFEMGKYTPPALVDTVSLCAQLLDMFEERNISVIRVGLHDQPEIKENFLGGAYHPALGELIFGERLYKKACSLFLEKNVSEGSVTISVNPAIISQMIGQKKKNIERFKNDGYEVAVKGDKSLAFGEIKLI
ncbi:MAG: radical SAM protein [Oscillospiraceae bacterium]|nr:radical SAM protein [Oscillospiraceae bacterium]